MKTMNATELRKDLFTVLDEALKGEQVLIHTRRGRVTLSKAQEKEWSQAGRRPKIPGCIHGDLKDADAALRSHIQWPQK